MGVTIPGGREWLIGPLSSAPQETTLPVLAIWWLVWVGVVWGIWWLRGAAIHEEWDPDAEPGEEVIWAHAVAVWRDALRVRAGALRTQGQEGGEFVSEVGCVWEKLVDGVRRVRETTTTTIICQFDLRSWNCPKSIVGDSKRRISSSPGRVYSPKPLEP